MKLPKQWLYWCRQANLTPEVKHYKENLIGLGRYWRVNSNGQFQMSETIDKFDRWSNSVEETHPCVPQTQKEFMDAVIQMIYNEKIKNGR